MFVISAFIFRLDIPMLHLTIKKLVQGLIMLVIVSAITFTLLASAGGDALTGLRENPQVSARTIEELQKVYGLDRPFAERYGVWLWGALKGDLGESFSFRIPVGSLVWTRFLNTLVMGLAAFLIAIMTAFSLSVLSVRYGGRVFRGLIETVVLLTASTPRMVLALLALLVTLWTTPAPTPTGSLNVTYLILGALALAVPLISVLLAQLRDGLDGVMSEDFIRLARAKGLSEWQVIARHALRATLNPFLTMSGLSLGGLLGGSVIVETVLGWPGVGALMVTAVRSRDIPLVMGVVLLASAAVWFGNTVADFLQVINDKRLRDGSRG